MNISYSLVRHLRKITSVSQQIRWETTMPSLNQEELVLGSSCKQWTKVIREAEKIVGYPTSFMNLRWLLSDEFANMALYLRKLVGSNHPLLQTAKNFLYNEHNNKQPWGLIILLLSKSMPVETENPSNNTYENQRVLAELTEMIRTGHLVHRGLINIPITNESESARFGNKIAILIGDYLLVTANGMLARIRNQDLSFIISSALRDLSEGEFFGARDSQNIALPSNPIKDNSDDDYEINSDTKPLIVKDVIGKPKREWTVRTIFGGASLLGRGCQGAALLAQQNEELQNNAFLFGCHLGLAWQASNELEKIANGKYSLVSAPVLFAIDENPELLQYVEKSSGEEVDLESLRNDILKTNCLEKTRKLKEEHVKKANSYVEMIGDNKSIDAIKDIIKTL